MLLADRLARKRNPRLWTSHAVLVVDQSASMRRNDLANGATRSDAVWTTSAKEFVAARLRSGAASDTDMLSVIVMKHNSKVS